MFIEQMVLDDISQKIIIQCMRCQVLMIVQILIFLLFSGLTTTTQKPQPTS